MPSCSGHHDIIANSREIKAIFRTTWHQEKRPATIRAPSQKDLRQNSGNYCPKSVTLVGEVRLAGWLTLIVRTLGNCTNTLWCAEDGQSWPSRPAARWVRLAAVNRSRITPFDRRPAVGFSGRLLRWAFERFRPSVAILDRDLFGGRCLNQSVALMPRFPRETRRTVLECCDCAETP